MSSATILRPAVPVLASVLLFAQTAAAKTDLKDVPVIWPEAEAFQVVTAPAVDRMLEGDESWTASTPRHQFLDTGDATRTITLPPIGPEGVPVGTRFVTRVTTREGHRILIRRSDGELIGFWGTGSGLPTQWAVLNATTTGWEARVSAGRTVSRDEPVIASLGARLVPVGEFVQPDCARTNGYALRFETDAPLVYVVCRANHPCFRVLVDGELVATVEIENRSGDLLRIPIEFGSLTKRKVEILADALEFGGLELPDVRSGVFAWAGAVPAARMLWLGDGSAETATHAYPWMVAHLLDYEVWSRPWGHHAQHVVGADRNAVPEAAIAEDIAAVNPDVIVISGHFFDDQLAPKEYAEVVASWLAAIEKASRPETVKIALSSWVNRSPVDRMTERRAGIIAKEARRSGFAYVNWQDWIEGSRDDPSWGNAHEIISANYVHFTPLGNAYVASQFAEQVRRLGVDRKVQVAAVKRAQSGAGVNNLAAAENK